MSAPTTTPLHPAMPRSIPNTWPGAVWVGQLDEPVTGALELHDGQGYASARLLVRRDGVPRGFVELPVHQARVSAESLQAALAQLPALSEPAGEALSEPLPPISVVLCTRDRPALLTAALASLAALDYPAYEVVVVDTNPRSGLTPRAVAEHGWPEIRVVEAPVPGLARARNVGVRAAAHELIAFTDDDVLVDSGWLRGIAAGFGTDPAVGCVSGIVPSGELYSLPQWYFDRRVTWARNCQRRRFSLSAPPPGERMFPFGVGNYGTGANFAVRRCLLAELGGFDEAFGAGSMIIKLTFEGCVL